MGASAMAEAIYVPAERPAVLPRDALGRFVTGAGYPQLWGSRTRMTEERFVGGVAAYIAECMSGDRQPSISECALRLGMDRVSFERWGRGEEMDASASGDCMSAFSYLQTAREAWLEERLPDKGYATWGIATALRNGMGDRWKTDAALGGPSGDAGGPAVAVTIQVAGMAERVTVDVAPTGGRTISASALAAEASRIADAGRGAVDADWSKADDDFE